MLEGALPQLARLLLAEDVDGALVAVVEVVAEPVLALEFAAVLVRDYMWMRIWGCGVGRGRGGARAVGFHVSEGEEAVALFGGVCVGEVEFGREVVVFEAGEGFVVLLIC